MRKRKDSVIYQARISRLLLPQQGEKERDVLTVIRDMEKREPSL